MPHQLPTEMLQTCDGLLVCLADWAYNVTIGWFWTMMLLGFVAVLVIGTQRFGSTRSFGFGSVVGLFGAIWLGTMQLMSWGIVSIFILAGTLGFVVMIMNEK